MILVLFFFLLTTMIMLLLMMAIPIINIQKTKDREKTSPFECGFDPISNSRISFSIQFFTISLMFLIFDIEITIIFPMPMVLKITELTTWIIMTNVIMLTLLMGLMLEWKEGSMNWK
uniref:NADH dehydrogenase subunit 3 n=1 Tax=Carsidara limbata TaxID=2591562 RepID=UPI003002FF9B|nr:NADH dehydrogenase subunit 3 [Carsidara limbata]